VAEEGGNRGRGEGKGGKDVSDEDTKGISHVSFPTHYPIKGLNIYISLFNCCIISCSKFKCFL
jgi:hypothetical protein